MTKSEFLDKLREALANDLTGPVIRENVDYYSEYISNEVKAGRSEAEVVAELGDPWVLARTVIDTAEGTANGQNTVYEQEKTSYGQGTGSTEVRTSGVGIFRLLLTLLGIIGILIVIVSVVGGIISLVAPIIIPVLIIWIIIRRINGRR